MPLLQKFIEYVKNENLFQKSDHLLLAVSGGVDSVVLCELCRQAGFDFEIAHCNFQLRGEESERDEAFVESLGDLYSSKVSIKKFDTQKYAAANKVSIQVAARELRYKWFEELLNEVTGIRYQVSGITHDRLAMRSSPVLDSASATTVLIQLCCANYADRLVSILK